MDLAAGSVDDATNVPRLLDNVAVDPPGGNVPSWGIVVPALAGRRGRRARRWV